jgi:hypothetical protein
VATPSGTTSTAQIAIRYSVPTSADWMPERSGMIRDGKLVMKSIDSRGSPSRATSKRIAPSPMNPTAIDRYMTARNARSAIREPVEGRGRTLLRVRAIDAIWAPVTRRPGDSG